MFQEYITKAKQSLDLAAGDLSDAVENSSGAEQLLARQLFSDAMTLLSAVAELEAAITEESEATCS